MQHKWHFTQQTFSISRAVCNQCGLTRTVKRFADSRPETTYRTASGNKAMWSVLSKAPPCSQFDGEVK
jgi:hypothetical protein